MSYISYFCAGMYHMWISLLCLSIYGIKSQKTKKRASLGIFKPKAQNIKTGILSKLEMRVKAQRVAHQAQTHMQNSGFTKCSPDVDGTSAIWRVHLCCDYKNKNWLQFLFIVIAAVLKQQISKFYPQILSTEDSFYIYERPLTEINVTASFCALNLRIKVWYLLF